MAFLAAALFAAALNRLRLWWREANLLQFWAVLMLLTLAAIAGAAAFVYAWL